MSKDTCRSRRLRVQRSECPREYFTFPPTGREDHALFIHAPNNETGRYRNGGEAYRKITRTYSILARIPYCPPTEDLRGSEFTRFSELQSPIHAVQILPPGRFVMNVLPLKWLAHRGAPAYTLTTYRSVPLNEFALILGKTMIRSIQIRCP